MKPINFLPESFLRAQRRKRRLVREGALVVLVVAGLIAAWAVRDGGTRQMRQYASALEAEVSAAVDQQSEIVRLQAEHRQLAHRVRIQRELSQPLGPTQVLTQMGAALPASVAIEEFSLIAERPKPTSRSAAAKRAESSEGEGAAAPAPMATAGPDLLRLEVQAIAPDELTVAQAVAGLSDHELFSHITMHYSRAAERPDVLGRVFKLSMRVDMNRRFVFEPEQQAAAEPSAVAPRKGVSRAN